MVRPEILNTIRHWEEGKSPTLQDLADNKTKNLTVTLELPVVLSVIDGWLLGGEGVARVRIIMDIGILSKLDTKILFSTQFGAYHDGSYKELLGDTIFDGGKFQPKDAKVYQI